MIPSLESHHVDAHLHRSSFTIWSHRSHEKYSQPSHLLSVDQVSVIKTLTALAFILICKTKVKNSNQEGERMNMNGRK